MLDNVLPGNNPVFIAAMVAVGLAAGWAAGAACKKVKLPAVIGYILVGIIMGNSVLGLFTTQNIKGLVFITYAALAFIGFDIGGELAASAMRGLGRPIFWATVLQALGAALLVTVGVYLYTGRLHEALIFGAIATTTAPITTAAVIREQKACGPLCTTTFSAVGIGDAMAVILYAIAVLSARVLLSGTGSGAWEMGGKPLLQMVGAVLLGIVAGLFLLAVTKEQTERGRLLASTLALIAITSVVSYLLGFSLILANLAMGAAAVNLTRYRRYDIFELARGVSPPVYIAFFVMVGAGMNLRLLVTMGWIGAIYIIARAAGKILGSTAGGKVSGAPVAVRRYLGVCLLPQGIVAIGLAAQTSAAMHGSVGTQFGVMVVTVISAAAIFFQLVGAPLARYAIVKSGEAFPEGITLLDPA